jgi:outer membrane biogenesis lipoprotein LolB
MTKLFAFLVATASLSICTHAAGAETATLKCEQWHPRLGQIADQTHAIDFTAKTCNGQPCAISENALRWQEQNGRAEIAINRTLGEGTLVYQGEAMASYKNCKLNVGKS